MKINYKKLSLFFDDALQELSCQPDTRAYIVSIFTKYESPNFDLSKDSLTLLFAQARNKQDFLGYQNLGDWLFYTKSLFPESLNSASEEYYNTIARLSYYSCFKLINKKWLLFEELAENFILLERESRFLLKKHI